MGGRPTVCLIDVSALKHNYGEISRLLSPAASIMAIVKANAYGHGDAIVANALAEAGCRLFGVAFLEEAVRIRKSGIKWPIVVLGGVYPDEFEDVFSFDLTPAVFDINTAVVLNGFAKKHGIKKKVHVKIDSGMGRLGVLPHQVVGFFMELKTLEWLTLDGVMSHFSEGEAEDKEYSKRQLSTFIKEVSIIEGMGWNPSYIHMANSAAIIEHVESQFNLVRAGLMLYGALPAARLREKVKLKPVMQIKTRIAQIKKLPPGFPVSYGRTFITKRESMIAVLPIGYGDGIPWRVSGKGEALVRGSRVPIAGRVCMDLTMIDVTDVKAAVPGDEVVMLGSQGDETITVEEIAEKAGTIPYEIFCNISSRVSRSSV